MKNFKKQLYLLAGVACFAVVASATPIGSENFVACATTQGAFSGVTVSAVSVIWSPTGSIGTAGCFTTSGGPGISYNNGSPQTITSPVTGNIFNLPFAGGPPFTFLTLPLSGLNFLFGGFEPANQTSGVCSESTALTTGSCVTSAGSPFLLTAGTAGTSVSLGVYGTVTDSTGTSPYIALFTTQIFETTAAIATTIDTGGSIGNAYSGTILIPTPEPGTIAMFLLGGIALLGIGRKQFGKR